jgi:hypothetical protein
MDVNATLLVQVLNFGITYLFLKKFLFAPVVMRIYHKESTQKRLIERLKQRELNGLELQRQKKEQLYNFRQSIKQKYSVGEKEMPVPDALVLTKQVFSDKDADVLVQHGAQVIVTKVVHAL